MKRVWQFATALAKTWGARVTGGVMIGILGVWQLTGHPVRPWIGWAVAIGGIVVACFETWNKQKTVAEQYKAALQQETDKVLNMRTALYKEIFFLYATIKSIKNEAGINASAGNLPGFVKTLRTDAYTFAKSQPDTFSKLPEAYKIEGLYYHIMVLKQVEPIHPESVLEIITFFVEKVEEAVRDPAFDLGLFQSIVQETKVVFAEQIAAKRKAGGSSSGA